jgi:hypothetical protein
VEGAQGQQERAFAHPDPLRLRYRSPAPPSNA